MPAEEGGAPPTEPHAVTELPAGTVDDFEWVPPGVGTARLPGCTEAATELAF